MNRKTSLSVTLVWTLALLFSVPCTVGDSVEARHKRFELFSNCSPMGLVIENLNSNAAQIGLKRETLQAAVESRLRSARLYTSRELAPYLYINVNVVGKAFNINVKYKKRVYDPASDNTFSATTWNAGTTGTHGGDAGYIRSAVSEIMDHFLLEFLRVNEEACEKR